VQQVKLGIGSIPGSLDYHRIYAIQLGRMMVEPAFSFKKWYEDHGDDLNRSRRKRYKVDPEYRARVQKMNRESRRRHKLEQETERRKLEKNIEIPTEKARPWKTVQASAMVGDKRVQAQLVTIGALARSLRCSVQAIRLWEKNGILPPTPLRNSKGDRLYTAEYVEMAVELLRAQGKLNEDLLRRRYDPRNVVRDVKFADGSIKRLVLLRVGTLARAMGRTVLTVEQMEIKGLLPETPFRASKTQYRLYTEEMVEVASEVMRKWGHDLRNDEGREKFRSEMRRRWEALKVFGAQLVEESNQWTKQEEAKRPKRKKRS
jgi:DNA-binding transcriptional MerR regulator